MMDSTENTESKEMSELRCELDKHFLTLKDEFEAKTGRKWTPLRAFDDEDWQWVDDAVGNTDGEKEFL
jgi:hypothetical protein